MELPEEYLAECNVCGQRYQNHAGSTPCCGSIAFVVDDDGQKTESIPLYVKMEEK